MAIITWIYLVLKPLNHFNKCFLYSRLIKHFIKLFFHLLLDLLNKVQIR